jgi:hypothetical protein
VWVLKTGTLRFYVTDKSNPRSLKLSINRLSKKWRYYSLKGKISTFKHLLAYDKIVLCLLQARLTHPLSGDDVPKQDAFPKTLYITYKIY